MQKFIGAEGSTLHTPHTDIPEHVIVSMRIWQAWQLPSELDERKLQDWIIKAKKKKKSSWA